MKILVASMLCLIFLLLASIHVYWAFGGRNGYTSAIPTNKNGKPVMTPGIIGCLVVAIGLLCFGTLVLIRSGIIFFRLPGCLANYGVWGIAAIFLLRAIGEFKYVGFLKKIKSTKFGQMDTKYYSPLCLLIAALAVVLSLITNK